MSQPALHIAIACGGTGGHLFPGLAVAEQLLARECSVTLVISPKEVDQAATQGVFGMKIVTLPAVGLQGGQRLAFVKSFVQAYRAATKLFRNSPVNAALAMGGFTSTAPILAARRLGIPTFLHESNAIPGRANRWLSWIVQRAFVGFPAAARRLHTRAVSVTGTPVRSQFIPRDPAACRIALGLEPARPVVLVMGGSQGASGINELFIRALQSLARETPALQFLHLAGPRDIGTVRAAYAGLKLDAVVHSFFHSMEMALGAATAAVTRAGASTLAELAAARVPAILIPFPAATDNHQYYNARALVDTGAAELLEQRGATPELLARQLLELVANAGRRGQMQQALAQWHSPGAAGQLAAAMLTELGIEGSPRTGVHPGTPRGGPSSANGGLACAARII